MKKILILLLVVMSHAAAFAQFAGVMLDQQEEPLPEGFKPASTNTFISQHPAVNPQTRQAIFRVVAPYAQSVQAQLGGNHYMKKDEKGVWWNTSDPLVVGFHYYAIRIDSAAVMDRGSEAFFGSNWEAADIEIAEGPEGDYRLFYLNVIVT